MPRVRLILKRLLLAAAALAAAAAVLSQAGRWSAHLDVLTHFAPVYLTVGLIVLVVAIATRAGALRLSFAVLGGVAVLSAASLVVPELSRPMSPHAPAGAPGAIKVIQFNAGDMTTALEPMVRWLAAQDADIVAVEESTPALRRRLAEAGVGHLACGLTCETAIFSRARPIEVEQPRRGRIGLGPAIVLARFEDGSGPFTVAAVHFGWPTDVATHRENSRRLLEILEGRPRERLIVVGDFNSTPWSFARRRDDQALGLERRTRALASWPARGLPGFPVLPIDHVYAGKGWRTVGVTRGPRIGSDHFPVVAVLAPSR